MTGTARDRRLAGRSTAGHRAAWRLSLGLAAVTVVGAAATFAAPDLLRGTAVMNGSARGTALVMLMAGVPAAVIGAAAARRGSDRAHLVWLGSLVFLVYNAIMLLAATPFNRLFLLYVAMLSLALAALTSLLIATDAEAIGAGLRPRAPVRLVAGYLGLIAGLNAAWWLRSVLPATLGSGPPVFLEGTGLVTNPVYIQDLAVWLPVAVLAAVWLWRRRPWGVVGAGAILTFWVLEGVTVAVDQWMGAQADPASSVASAGNVLPFAVLAAISLGLLGVLLSGVSGRPSVTVTREQRRWRSAPLTRQAGNDREGAHR